MKQAKIGKKTLKRLVAFPGFVAKSRQKWKDKDCHREPAAVRCYIFNNILTTVGQNLKEYG